MTGRLNENPDAFRAPDRHAGRCRRAMGAKAKSGYSARSAYRELSHAAGAKATDDDQAFCLFPRFQLEKAPNDQRELLREFLDRTLDNSGRLWITVAEQAIKLLLGDFLVDLVSLGVYSGLR